MKKWTVQASNNHQDHKNALILNGDRCLCRKKHDVWYAYGMPWSGSSGEYINRRVPFGQVNFKTRLLIIAKNYLQKYLYWISIVNQI